MNGRFGKQQRGSVLPIWKQEVLHIFPNFNPHKLKLSCMKDNLYFTKLNFISPIKFQYIRKLYGI